MILTSFFEIGVKEAGKSINLFVEALKPKSIVKYFTRDLLIKAPGIQIAVAINEIFSNQQFLLNSLRLYLIN